MAYSETRRCEYSSFVLDPVLLEIILRTELWSCERTAGFMYHWFGTQTTIKTRAEGLVAFGATWDNFLTKPRDFLEPGGPLSRLGI